MIETLTSPPGTGKTFSVVHWVCEDFLPNEQGVLHHNLPLNVDTIADYVNKKFGIARNQVIERLQEVPTSELKKWERAKVADMPVTRGMDEEAKLKAYKAAFHGPWSYFGQLDLQGAIIILDEVHNWISSTGMNHLKFLWNDWLGELRHYGVRRVRFISQDETKIATCIRNHTSKKFGLFNGIERRDPFFGIACEDWQELRSAFLTNVWDPMIFEQEQIKVHGKDRWNAARRFRLGPPYYDFYESYSTSYSDQDESQGQTAAIDKNNDINKRKYEKWSKSKLLYWFIRKNFWPVFSRIVIVSFAVWFFFLGGMNFCWGFFQNFTGQTLGTQSDQNQEITDSSQDQVDKDVYTREEYYALKQIVDEVPELIATNEKLQVQVARLKSQLEREHALIAISNNSVLFKNGDQYKVGQTILRGPYQGTTITNIYNRQRAVLLSDSTTLYMGPREGQLWDVSQVTSVLP